MKQRPVAQRLVALFAAGWLVFGFPLMGLWLHEPLVMFGWWALLIALAAWIVEADEPPADDAQGRAPASAPTAERPPVPAPGGRTHQQPTR